MNLFATGRIKSQFIFVPTKIQVYIYIYVFLDALSCICIYKHVCVCVCVCVCVYSSTWLNIPVYNTSSSIISMHVDFFLLFLQMKYAAVHNSA